MKTSVHRQAILIFGIALPFLAIIGLLVGTLIGRGKLNDSHTNKVANLEAYQTGKTQVNELESFLAKEDRRDKITYWNSKLDQDFIQSLTENLNKILARYDPSVLKQTEMGQAGGSGSIGGLTDNPHARIQLSFEGGFKPMQILLAELENEMPHLILENLSVRSRPAATEEEDGNLLFSVVYLCWEKPKA